MGDKIYLWDDLAGWASYDIDDETTLSKRGISICAEAKIGDGAKIGDRANIGDGENPTIIYIVGSCHGVAYWGEDRVDIGCISKSIGAWLDGPHAGLIRDNGYTNTQVDEYRQYVGMIRDIHYAVKGGE